MLHRIFADNTNKGSAASRLREKRFHLFVAMLNEIPSPVKILDVGGTQKHWEMMAKGSSLLERIQVTLLNIKHQSISMLNFSSVEGDARNMPQFADGQFDIIYSNSTIEHVGNLIDQKHMASEVARVGKRYFVQTPNRYFPIEPHFVFPFFQFFPISLRAWLIQNFKLGWYPKIADAQQALSTVKSIRLMTKSEVQEMFPDAEIFDEKYLGLTKSFVAYTREK